MMRKILLASAAAAALLVGPAIAQNVPEKPGTNAQQNQPKAGAPDKVQKPGTSAQSQPDKAKDQRQVEGVQDKAKGASDVKRQTTGQSNQPESKGSLSPG